MVGVVSLELNAVGLGVVEGVLLPATVATESKFDAIDGLLLREIEELTVLDLVGTLHGAGGGESPAGTALSLVSDGADGAVVSPVDSVGDGILVTDDVDLSVLGSGHVLESETAELGLLSLSPGGELVVSNVGGGGVVGVVLSDESIGGLEEVLSEVVLLNGTVGESLLRDVLHELEVVGLNSGGDTGEGKSDEGLH